MVRAGSYLAAVLLLAAACLLAPAPARAQRCLACHLASQERTLSAMSWQGPLAVETQSLCPGVRAVKRELFFTESRLVQASNLLAALSRRGMYLQPLSRLLAGLTQDYRGLLAGKVDSAAQARAGLSELRRRIDEQVLRPLWQREQSRRRARAFGLGLAVLVGLGLLALIGWQRLLAARRRAQAGRRP